MSRIRRAFENRFRELLGELGARDRQKGVELLVAKAEVLSSEKNYSISRALADVNQRLAQRVHRFDLRRGRVSSKEPVKIICDAGLGGLARWLRASGWETFWIQDITDEMLVREAERLRAVIVTTDSFLLDRKPIKEGRVKAYWVPPTLKKMEQLRLIKAELNSTPGESRCMRCGGELIAVSKESVRDFIPPKTYNWVDEYYQCERCGHLFWHGTHWKKISRELDLAGG